MQLHEEWEFESRKNSSALARKKKIDRDRNRQNIKKRNIKERKALPFLVGEDDNERVFVRVLRVSFIGKFKR
jgi:hypothetical protein